MPFDNNAAGIADADKISGNAVKGVKIDDGKITITYNDKVKTGDPIVLLTPDIGEGSIKWGCKTGTTVDSKLLPAHCRP